MIAAVFSQSVLSTGFRIIQTWRKGDRFGCCAHARATRWHSRQGNQSRGVALSTPMVRPDTVWDDAMLVEDPMSVRSCADMCGATTDVRFGPIAEIGSGLFDYFIRAAEQRRRPDNCLVK